jgi:xanthine dehydrogenase YagR molybdenum-binding subunit
MDVEITVQVHGTGLGEIGSVGAAAAIANAVFNATGIRIRDLPITLDKILMRQNHPLM